MSTADDLGFGIVCMGDADALRPITAMRWLSVLAVPKPLDRLRAVRQDAGPGNGVAAMRSFARMKGKKDQSAGKPRGAFSHVGCPDAARR